MSPAKPEKDWVQMEGVVMTRLSHLETRVGDLSDTMTGVRIEIASTKVRMGILLAISTAALTGIISMVITEIAGLAQ
jgi:hypothetical protein